MTTEAEVLAMDDYGRAAEYAVMTALGIADGKLLRAIKTLMAERDAALAMVAVIRDRAASVMAKRRDNAATVCEERLIGALTVTRATAAEYERRVRAEGVYLSWMDGWLKQPEGIEKPTMDEAMALIAALTPPASAAE